MRDGTTLRFTVDKLGDPPPASHAPRSLVNATASRRDSVEVFVRTDPYRYPVLPAISRHLDDRLNPTIGPTAQPDLALGRRFVRPQNSSPLGASSRETLHGGDGLQGFSLHASGEKAAMNGIIDQRCHQ